MQKFDLTGRDRSVAFYQATPWCSKIAHGVHLYYAGFCESVDNLCELIAQGETQLEYVIELLLANKQSFAIIAESKNHVFVAVDRIRTIPVFIGRDSLNTIVSNHAPTLLDQIKNKRINWDGVNQFLLSGYVHGAETLYESISSPVAGTLLFISKIENRIIERSYYEYLPSPTVACERKSLIKEFGEIVDSATERTIKFADGRPIWVPLSGGLDSRLVLSKLKEHGCRDLNCFTYGISGNHEILMARRAAEKLDVRWLFIPSNVKALQEIYASKKRRHYADYADGLLAVPSYAEYEAFLEITRKKLIPKESIIVNGQSGDFLFGGHVPSELENVSQLDQIVTYILTKHCMHWPDIMTLDTSKTLFKSVRRQLERFSFGEGASQQKDELLALYEAWEFLERQPKAAISNQRLYEYFGYGWSLPLWDADLIEFWAKVPYEEKKNQRLHRDYLKHYNFRGVFDWGRAPQRAYVNQYVLIIWAARILGSIGGENWKQRFYEYMFYYTYFRSQLGMFGRQYYVHNYAKTRRPRVVAFGARSRLQELGILGIDRESLPFLDLY